MDNFVFFRGVDQGGNDVGKYTGSLMDNLTAAAADTAVVAVNTLGFAKTEVSRMAHSCWFTFWDGLYVKKSYMIAKSNTQSVKVSIHKLDEFDQKSQHLHLYILLLEDVEADAYVIADSACSSKYDSRMSMAVPPEFDVYDISAPVIAQCSKSTQNSMLYWEAPDGGPIALTRGYVVSKAGAAKLSAFAAEHSAWQDVGAFLASAVHTIRIHTSKIREFGPVFRPVTTAHSFDWVYYINLEHRTDRLEQVRSELIKVGWQSQSSRIDAVHTPDDGAVGCGLSHIRALETFLASENTTALVLEDDVEWTEDPCKPVSLFLQTHNDWDVVMLASNTLSETYHTPLSTRVVSAATTSAYGITRAFAERLLAHWRSNQPSVRSNACDMSWRQLQPESNWFCLLPKVAKQRESYSDVDKTFRNYGL